MSVTGKYVFGRVAKPKPLRILKDYTLSIAKNQDTDASTYLKACKIKGIHPDHEFLAHLRQRDKNAWASQIDWIMDGPSIGHALCEAKEIVRRMRQENGTAPRSPSACNLCDWSSYCSTDPSGIIASWFGVRPRRSYSGASDVYHYDGGTISADKQFIVSPSQMQSFMTCPRQWYFSYKLRKEPTKLKWSKVSARTYGILVHEGCAALAEHWLYWDDLNINTSYEVAHTKDADLNLIAKVAIEAKVAELKQHIEDEEQDWRIEECYVTAVRMFRLATSNALQIIEAEQRRIFRLPGTYSWVTCQPDLVIKNNLGDREVIDYKTTNNQYLDRVADRYLNHPAMFLYAHAVQHGHPTKGEFDGS